MQVLYYKTKIFSQYQDFGIQVQGQDSDLDYEEQGKGLS